MINIKELKKSTIVLSLLVIAALFSLLVFVVLFLGDDNINEADYLLAKQEAIEIATTHRNTWLVELSQAKLPSTQDEPDEFDSYLFENELIHSNANIGAVSSVDEKNSIFVNYQSNLIYYRASNGLYVTISYSGDDIQTYVISKTIPNNEQGYISWYV